MLHQKEGGIGKSILDVQEISQGRRRWIIYIYLPSFGGVRTFSSSSIHIQGRIRKFISVARPTGQGRIDSIKINLSLLRMRERRLSLAIFTSVALETGVLCKRRPLRTCSSLMRTTILRRKKRLKFKHRHFKCKKSSKVNA